MSCSCDYEPVAWSEATTRKSRKVRRCCECGGTIAPGERYIDLRYVALDDAGFRWLTLCPGCNDIMQYFCLPFEGVMEELRNSERLMELRSCGPSCGGEDEEVMGPAGRAKLNEIWWSLGYMRNRLCVLHQRYTPERWRKHNDT